MTKSILLVAVQLTKSSILAREIVRILLHEQRRFNAILPRLVVLRYLTLSGNLVIGLSA